VCSTPFGITDAVTFGRHFLFRQRYRVLNAFRHHCTACLRRLLGEGDLEQRHIGGDDVVSIVNQVLQAVADGYKIVTWYGPKTDVLIAGYREHEISFSKHASKKGTTL
jgi:hypothetical protein